MRRFLTLVFMFCLAIPAGITISGCTRNPAGDYCYGLAYGLKNTDVASITLQPQTTGISLAFALSLGACTPEETQPGGTGGGGNVSTGGTSGLTGGTSSTGGKGTGGATGTTGGSATGGKASGGTATGGQATGGANTGGVASGGSGGGGGATSAGCGKTPTISSSQYNNGTTISITVNNTQRRYILNVPTNYNNSTPYKLVLAIHELNGNDKEMYNQKYYGLLSLSNNTTIFAAPNGTQSNGSPCSGTGSGDSGCGWPSGNNNMALMDAVVAQVEQNFCVDTNRIFATGWSYGASMSYEVGCQRPLGGTSATWGVRAIAIYSGAQMSGSCKPSSSYPVAFYESHGTHDSVLQYSGGVTLCQNWSNADGCTWQTPTQVTSGAHVCTKMTGCKSGYPVEFCSFNGDHTPYPDSGSASSSWGPQEVWTFLSQF